jgi:hypothetical protein
MQVRLLLDDLLRNYTSTYPNVATEFISNIRTGTTYPNVTPEFISDIRTGRIYPNVAVPVLISEMNSVANIRVSRSCSNIREQE